MPASKPQTIADQFPADFFPPGIEAFRLSLARSIGVADEYLAVPMLAAASAAIGTTHRVVVKHGWEEPASLFTAIVGWPSVGKTPGVKGALAPLAERQQRYENGTALPAGEQYARLDHCPPCDSACEPDEFSLLSAASDGDHSCGENAPTWGQSPCEQPHHIRRRKPQLILRDTTLPALWDCLADNPRGVIVVVDELGRIFQRMPAAERQTWCEIYQCDSRSVHRKSNKHGPIYIPRTFTTICGGIQPDLFKGICGEHHGGLVERFLICGLTETSLPPLVDDVVDPDAELAWHLSMGALLSIERAEYHGSASHRGRVHFSKAAYDRLKLLRNALEAYLVAQGVHIKYQGIARKLTANAARLALIRRAIRWATGEFGFYGPVGQIDESDIDVACRAAEFFLSRYLYWRPSVLHTAGQPITGEPAAPMTLTDRLLAYLASKGRTEVEVRWLRQQTLEGNPSTAEIRAALDEAVARGQGRWQDEKKKVYVAG